jgi:hypothetical protein
MMFPQQLGLSILDDLVGDGCLRIPRHRQNPHGRSWKNAMKSSTSWGFTRSTTSTGAAGWNLGQIMIRAPGIGFSRFERLVLNSKVSYPLVMTNIAMVKPWPIEIDGLPIKHGDFPCLC